MEEERATSAEAPHVKLTDDSYLVKERKPYLALRLLEQLVEDGRKGLIVSRRHPSKLKERETLKDVRMIWLSHTPGEDFHNPRSLGSLNRLICNFIKDNDPAVVLVDGLEYLILNNDFVQTLLFVEHLNEFAMQTPAVVLFPVDQDALEAKELALLERNLEVLEGEEFRREMERRKVVNLIDAY